MCVTDSNKMEHIYTNGEFYWSASVCRIIYIMEWSGGKYLKNSTFEPSEIKLTFISNMAFWYHEIKQNPFLKEQR